MFSKALHHLQVENSPQGQTRSELRQPRWLWHLGTGLEKDLAVAGQQLGSVISELPSNLNISMILSLPAVLAASAVGRGREQQSPEPIPAGFLPGYLVRARQDFFLQAVQHALDGGHASVELMDLQERGERDREREKEERTEQTSHHSEETSREKQAAGHCHCGQS